MPVKVAREGESEYVRITPNFCKKMPRKRARAEASKDNYSNSRHRRAFREKIILYIKVYRPRTRNRDERALKYEKVLKSSMEVPTKHSELLRFLVTYPTKMSNIKRNRIYF